MIKKALLILVSFGILSFQTDSDKTTHEFTKSNCYGSYQTKGGRMEGNYISFYKNGKKKAEGTFESNYRTGIWSVWDTAGHIHMQRDYSGPFSFRQIYPPSATPAKEAVQQYSKEGYSEYFQLNEEMIVWSKRVWRELTPDGNPLLFNNNRLFAVLYKNIQNHSITAFDITDDEFRNELQTIADSSALTITGYKVKEDCFFDNVRKVSETRVIGICASGMNKITGKTGDLFWVYMPEIRKALASEKLQNKYLPSRIKTLDDVFFYRYFCSRIYKESNFQNKPIAAYTPEQNIKSESERIETDITEAEHNWWLELAKP